jgi:hypothetical protein
MYLRHLSVQNVKLLRSFELPFVRPDGTPRMWTVIIGENGLCKTTLLQTIALAALGKDRANQLADIPSLRDQRAHGETVSLQAELGFGALGHERGRSYPGLAGADRFAPVQLIGTGFADLLAKPQAREYAKSLKRALLEQAELLPNVRDLELGGRSGVTKAEDLVKKHRFSYSVGGKAHKLPATWLSHGYQSTIAWIADLVGHVMWEADKQPVPAEEMEGLVLVDELDLHLHPRWQVGLVQALKRTFPRLQFIVTTHSPMLLPGLEADEVVRLTQDEEGNVVWRAPGRSPKLMTGSDLYETFFELPGTYPEDLAAALRTYTNLAADPDRDDEEEAALSRAHALLRDAGIDLEWEPRPRRADDAHDSH